MTRTNKRKPANLAITWLKDEEKDWEGVLLLAFDLLFGDDPLPPVDKLIDRSCQNPHHVDN
jgi:hypothetical protein